MFRFLFFFFNDTATTEIYTLSLHDALPISVTQHVTGVGGATIEPTTNYGVVRLRQDLRRSEEHTSELQSQSNLVCRLLLEKKNTALRVHRDCGHCNRHTDRHAARGTPGCRR